MIRMSDVVKEIDQRIGNFESQNMNNSLIDLFHVSLASQSITTGNQFLSTGDDDDRHLNSGVLLDWMHRTKTNC